MDLFIIRRCLVLILGGSRPPAIAINVSRPFFEMTSLCFQFFPYAIVMHDVN